jgi:ribosomal protein S6E (S10)
MKNQVKKFDQYINESFLKKEKDEPNIAELKREITRVLNQKVATVNPDQHTGDWKKSERGKTISEILTELSAVIADFRKK